MPKPKQTTKRATAQKTPFAQKTAPVHSAPENTSLRINAECAPVTNKLTEYIIVQAIQHALRKLCISTKEIAFIRSAAAQG